MKTPNEKTIVAKGKSFKFTKFMVDTGQWWSHGSPIRWNVYKTLPNESKSENAMHTKKEKVTKETWEEQRSKKK